MEQLPQVEGNPIPMSTSNQTHSGRKKIIIIFFCIVLVGILGTLTFLIVGHYSKKSAEVNKSQHPNFLKAFTLVENYINESLIPKYHSKGELLLYNFVRVKKYPHYSGQWITDEGLTISTTFYSKESYQQAGKRELDITSLTPSDISLFIKIQNPEKISTSSAKMILDRYFISNEITTDKTVWVQHKDPQTAETTILETTWDNPNNTKEVRGILFHKNGSTNQSFTYTLMACRLYPNYPNFDKGGCFVNI